MFELASWLDQVSIFSPAAFAIVAFAGLTMGVAPSSFPIQSPAVLLPKFKKGVIHLIRRSLTVGDRACAPYDAPYSPQEPHEECGQRTVKHAPAFSP